MTRLGKVEPTQGSESMGLSQRVLHQSGQAKEPDVLCQGEVDPFWGEGYLLIPRAEAIERLQGVQTTLREPYV